MKVKVNNSEYIATDTALKALLFSSLNNGDVKVLDGVPFVWYKNSSNGEHVPDDIPVDTLGSWKKSIRLIKSYVSFVDNAYDFAGNSATDLSSHADIMNIALMLCAAYKKDYLYMQHRVDDVFQAKTGATNTLKWSNCNNSERDLIIYYNQMKESAAATEGTDKVVHLITTGQVADAAAGGTFLKKTHAESIGRAKPDITSRVDSDKLVEIIITYLNRVDTNQLLNTVKTHLANYKAFAMVGTIIYGEEEALRDYLESTGPTYFENGLIEENWTTENAPATLSDLRDELINILFGDNE